MPPPPGDGRDGRQPDHPGARQPPVLLRQRRVAAVRLAQRGARGDRPQADRRRARADHAGAAGVRREPEHDRRDGVQLPAGAGLDRRQRARHRPHRQLGPGAGHRGRRRDVRRLQPGRPHHDDLVRATRPTCRRTCSSTTSAPARASPTSTSRARRCIRSATACRSRRSRTRTCRSARRAWRCATRPPSAST